MLVIGFGYKAGILIEGNDTEAAVQPIAGKPAPTKQLYLYLWEPALPAIAYAA